VSWLSAVAFAAGVDVSGGNLTVDTGNIVATAGSVSAGTTITAGTGITTTTGNVSEPAGNEVVGSLAAESLTNGALTAGTGWAVTGDFALSAGTAVYTDATHTGTLKQVVANQATPALANQRYRFQYDVTANTMTNGVVTITTSYAATAKILDMTVGTGKIAYFTSAAAPTDFIVSVTGSTGGAFTLDNLSLMATIGGNITAVGRLNGIAGGEGINVDTNGNVHMAGLIVNYGGLPTAGRGIAVIRATFTKTGGTTSIAAQNLMTAAPAGFYKADVYTQVTTQSTGACTATVALAWTYNSQSKTVNVINAFSLATNNVESDGTQRMVVDASTNITLANTIAGVGCTSQVWDLYVVLERLN
jgi:hypothetical protein